MNKLVSDAARAMQAHRKRKVGGFNDPKVREVAMKKSLETRRTNAQKQQNSEGQEATGSQDKAEDN